LNRGHGPLLRRLPAGATVAFVLLLALGVRLVLKLSAQ
jgi:hypothetical protein